MESLPSEPLPVHQRNIAADPLLESVFFCEERDPDKRTKVMIMIKGVKMFKPERDENIHVILGPQYCL